MKATKLPTLKPAPRFLICLGLIILTIWLWFNAALIGLALVALIPALFNTLSILPVRAIVIFLVYSIAVCGYAILGYLMIILMNRLRKGGELKTSYMILLGVALGLIVLSHFALSTKFILLIGL